jgi:cyclopropane fatty-acyl-phospholipid synthase-like methyltransferase
MWRMNEILANKVRIAQSDMILDAGCGIGGSSIWLAEHIGCRVVGIDITESQLTIARKDVI